MHGTAVVSAILLGLIIILLIAARMGRFLGGSFVLTLVVVVTLAAFLWYLRYQRSGGGAAYDDLATRYSGMERDDRFRLLDEWDKIYAGLIHTLGDESHVIDSPGIATYTDTTTGQITKAFDAWEKRACEALIKAWYADKDEAYRATKSLTEFERSFKGQSLSQIAAGFKERKPKVMEPPPRPRTPSEIVEALRAAAPKMINIEEIAVEDGVHPPLTCRALDVTPEACGTKWTLVRVTGRVEITDGHEMGSISDFCDRAKGLEGVSDAQLETWRSLEKDGRSFVRFVMVVKPKAG